MRQTDSLRSLVRETRLTPTGFIYPLFICPGEGVRKEIGSMPGVFNLSVDQAVKEAREAKALGVGGIILFGLPEKKDEVATGAWADDGIVQRATRAIKREVRDLVVIGDVCLCEYMSHGHCGIVQKKSVPGGNDAGASKRGSGNGGRAVATQVAAEVEYEILNDPTLEILARTAVSQAKAGMDIIAPSDMMDGRVGAIRQKLDAHGFQKVSVLAYAAKFASGFYGPFREAAESTPQFGDRRTYQMDPANGREAMHEMELDLEEGADMLMVKPAMPYLDLVRQARDRFPVPIGAYQVSGEFSMIMAAVERGWLDYERIMMESLTSIRRAGADFILTYFARDASRVLG
jgi:porphobilinogen synthase